MSKFTTMKRHIIILFVLSMISFSSCKKYLDAKSNQIFSTPQTLKDLQALLDNENFYKWGTTIMGQTGTDEYYLPNDVWNSLGELHNLGYIWDPNLNDYSDWTVMYENVLLANTVLDNWGDIVGENLTEQANEIRAAALFHRSFNFWQIAQIFAPQYDPATSTTDLGIVLRLSGDFNVKSERASVKESYDQIINDLIIAVDKLPVTPQFKTRPGKAAAYALLARTYLQIGDYDKAKDAADNCLEIYEELMDYNDPTLVDPNSYDPFLTPGVNHKEVIYYANDANSLNVYFGAAFVPMNLYNSFADNDLRKATFFYDFGGVYSFKGSYNSSVTFGCFVGLSTSEVYLIRAEANARLDNKDIALNALNTLLVNRFQTGTFVPVTAAASSAALDIILEERKKEMLNRGMRWSDLKRLNKEPARAITIERELDGVIYKLVPNDNRYTLLIPREVMRFVDFEQNPR